MKIEYIVMYGRPVTPKQRKSEMKSISSQREAITENLG